MTKCPLSTRPLGEIDPSNFHMSQNSLYLGLDLGTSNSCAALFDGVKVTMVRNAQGAVLTPSIVRIDAKGRVSTGAKAARFLESDPQNTRSEFKRLMGTGKELAFPKSGLRFSPESLAAEILKNLLTSVAAQTGARPIQAVVTVPALFELPQSGATSEAARLAGLEKIELIQEPVASALAAGWSADQSEGKWIVFDLGGGTFDVSLLETRDGLLRVVGHDGDNFLGGRDFDAAIVDFVIEELKRESGVQLQRSNPDHGPALRVVKQAAEEAKHELTHRSETQITLLEPLEIDGEEVEVDILLTRETLDRLCLPLVQRSLDVCQRLLAHHQVSTGDLERVVLVGGPSVMPLLRNTVAEQLETPLSEGHDPMTIVAEGAALYAASSGLAMNPVQESVEEGHPLWLQYPPVSSDLFPHVVGRVLSPQKSGAPRFLRLVRTSDGWRSEPVEPDENGAFVLSLELLPKVKNEFTFVAGGEGSKFVQVRPSGFSIVQGLTISDPPLSRTVGIALADGSVREYFKKGSPLPLRRTFQQKTVDAVIAGGGGDVLNIPIVQGEFDRAELCRLVGQLEIPASELEKDLPAGTSVELTLELDRGGRLTATALIPSLGKTFDGLAHLLVPEADPEVLRASLQVLTERLRDLRSEAFRGASSALISASSGMDERVKEVERDLSAAEGGDADAAQRARRTLKDLDARLEELHLERHWPELEEQARDRLAWAFGWVSEYGTDPERRLLDEAAQAVEQARSARDAGLLERRLVHVLHLGNASYFRNPAAWENAFEDAAADSSACNDQVQAQRLVEEGRKAQRSGDRDRLRGVVQELWELLPPSADRRRKSFGSGVR